MNEQENIQQKMYMEDLHRSAAAGDVEDVNNCLKAGADIDIQNDRGWTALMFAVRNGHLDVAKLLVEKNCDVNKRNYSGQTAVDIAKFWKHDELVQFLTGRKSDGKNQEPIGHFSVNSVNFFSASPLDRCANNRSDDASIRRAMTDSSTSVFLPFRELLPYVVTSSEQKGLKASLATMPYSKELDELLTEHSILTVFLGVAKDRQTQNLVQDSPVTDGEVLHKEGDDNSISSSEQKAWFALDVSQLDEALLTKLLPTSATILRSHYDLMRLSRAEAAIAGHARSMLAWHDRYKHCPTCGKLTTVRHAGYKRECIDADCRSNKGIHNTCYPRTDPTVIMAVLSPDRKKLLLGRKPSFPRGFYSCLAGFMEPGESIEEACRREVEEESGIRVDRVFYHSSQPWPMPSSLMIGCIAYATTDKITIDRKEMEDVRWFELIVIRDALSHRQDPNFSLPPPVAIAHQLITYAISNGAKL